MGRFVGSGKVGVIAGSLGLRDHHERLDGFRDVLHAEFPGVEVLPALEGRDDDAQTEARAEELLAAHPALRGIYNLGAGNAGLIAALEASGRAGKTRVIAHELADPTRGALKSGTIDVVLDQNPDREIRAAVAAARALALGAPPGFQAEPIEIGIFLRDNLI
jgi:LacI family transcriptional regulator